MEVDGIRFGLVAEEREVTMMEGKESMDGRRGGKVRVEGEPAIGASRLRGLMLQLAWELAGHGIS